MSAAQGFPPRWKRLRQQVFAAKGRRCWWCGGFATHVDHLVPRWRGGPHTLANLVPSCKRCNLSRGGKDGQRARMARRQAAAQLAQRGRPSRNW